jgi:hypothetical protein
MPEQSLNSGARFYFLKVWREHSARPRDFNACFKYTNTDRQTDRHTHTHTHIMCMCVCVCVSINACMSADLCTYCRLVGMAVNNTHTPYIYIYMYICVAG